MSSDFTKITSDCEVLTIRHDKIAFVVMYRPAGAIVSEFLAFLEIVFKFVVEKKSTLFPGGDFKIDMLSHGKHQLELSKVFQSYSFSNTIHHDTRVTLQSSMLLDMLITNVSLSQTRAEVLQTDITDHLPIFY